MSVGNQLFILYPIVISLEPFKSQRPENLVKLALKSSKKVTITQSITRGAGQT